MARRRVVVVIWRSDSSGKEVKWVRLLLCVLKEKISGVDDDMCLNKES